MRRGKGIGEELEDDKSDSGGIERWRVQGSGDRAQGSRVSESDYVVWRHPRHPIKSLIYPQRV